MLAAVNTPVSNVHLQRRKHSTPSSAPDVAGAIAMPLGGINLGITDDFPTNFHVPSRRTVRRRLAAQATGSSLEFAAVSPLYHPSTARPNYRAMRPMWDKKKNYARFVPDS